MSPEEQAAHWQSVQDTLARADRVLDETARREIPERLWEAPQQPAAPAAEPPRPVQRAMAPPMPDKVQIPQHDSSGRVVAIKSFEGHASVSAAVSWESWVRKEIRSYVDRQIEEVTAGVGQALGQLAREIGGDVRELKKRLAGQDATIARLTEQLAASDAAVVDLLMQIERRLGALEQPPVPQAGKPRLVGGSDAA